METLVSTPLETLPLLGEAVSALNSYRTGSIIYREHSERGLFASLAKSSHLTNGTEFFPQQPVQSPLQDTGTSRRETRLREDGPDQLCVHGEELDHPVNREIQGCCILSAGSNYSSLRVSMFTDLYLFFSPSPCSVWVWGGCCRRPECPPPYFQGILAGLTGQ